VLARVQQDEEQGRILFLRGPDDGEGYRHVAEAVQDLETQRAMQRARIGVIGKPSDWLVASTPAPDAVRSAWGPDVVAIELDAVERRVSTVSQVTVTSQLDALFDSLTDRREPPRVDVEKAVRVYLALQEVIEQYELNALTLRCFDLVLDMETTGCLALAQLNDEEIIAGCEGDVVTTVGLLWAHELLGQIAWMANPVRVDEAQNSLWLAHCTVPRGIVDDYCLRSHFESGLGVAIQGRFPLGPVTLFRIGGRNLDRLWLAEGEVIQAGSSESLCRTQAEIRLEAGFDVGDLLREPLGNHVAMLKGHHLARLQAWHETVIRAA
jgi:L-fucose isomerase-like protein